MYFPQTVEIAYASAVLQRAVVTISGVIIMNRSVDRTLLLVGAIAISVLLMGLTCEEKKASPVVARVGSSVLTLDDIYSSIPPEYSGRLTRQQHVNFVKQWINNELLYQEALRLKLNREKDIRDRLAKMKRDLLSAELLSRRTPSSQDIRITDDMVLRYYQEHQPEFIRQQKVFRYLQIVVGQFVTAWKVRNQVTKDNFVDLAAKYSQVPVEDPRNVPYLEESMIPPELRDVLSGLRVGGTTAPLKLSNRFVVVRLLDKQNKGTQATLGEVRDEIIDRLSTEVQKKKIDAILSTLRMKTDVSFNFDLLPGAPTAEPEENTDSLSSEQPTENPEM